MECVPSTVNYELLTYLLTDPFRGGDSSGPLRPNCNVPVTSRRKLDLYKRITWTSGNLYIVQKTLRGESLGGRN